MQNGFSQALATFKFAASHVPAYKKVLREKNILPGSIKSETDFKRLPILDKKTYLQRFPVTELVPDRHMPAIAYASSGSTGTPTFWFRNTNQETTAARAHAEILRTFGIAKKDPTLVLICFSMGVWVAGNSEFFAFHDLVQRGYRLSIATPGIERADILHALQQLGPHFKYIILAGYPPFIKNLLYHAAETHLSVKGNIRIVTSGDSFTETWRTEVLRLIGSRNPCHVLNIYGCADLGFLGQETRLSISLRRAAANNSALRARLFGNEPHEPAMVQYDPSSLYVEQFSSELLFTARAGIPLIRYNLHDIGAVIPYPEAREIAKMKDTSLFRSAAHKYPIIVKHGRTDVAVTYYSLNIYPTHLETPLKKLNLPMLSGNLVAYTQEGKIRGRQRLHIAVELAPGMSSTENTTKKIQDALIAHLLEHNIEYRKLFHTLAHKAVPVVSVKKFGQLPKVRFGLLVQQGKKPRMVV